MTTGTDRLISYRVTNPATGEVVEEFETATDAEIEQALADSAAAYVLWRAMPIEERARIVRQIGQLFEERAAELASIISREMGKPPAWGAREAGFCKDIFQYYAADGPGLLADQPVKVISAPEAIANWGANRELAEAYIQKLPIGSILGIMPWNYPYYQVARFAAPNLLLGNTVIIKHAESCPRSALAISQLMIDAGLPENVYINVFASHSQIADMIADPRVQGVSLTGSERAGAAVAEIAGRNLKKVVLELGGSDPYILLDTDDIRSAAEAAWSVRMGNMGQSCTSNKRMIVMADIYDEFVAELVGRASNLKPFDPSQQGQELDTGTSVSSLEKTIPPPAKDTFGPLSSRSAAERLVAQIRDAVDQGANLLVGGRLLEGAGAYVEPAVLTGVTRDMRAYSEELFGPVCTVYRVNSDDEAVALANDSQFGLGAAVFSRDETRAANVAARLETGMASVNIPGGLGPAVPFGGVKRSGFGRELGPLGLEEFANRRLFYVQR